MTGRGTAASRPGAASKGHPTTGITTVSGWTRERRARMHEMPENPAGGQTKPTSDPYIQQEGAGPRKPARLGRSMLVPRNFADSLVDRLLDLLDRVVGSIAAPARPAPAPVPVRTNPPYRRVGRR